MNTLWIEKYRPQTFDDLVGQKHAAKMLKGCVEAKNLPHLMVIGKSGTGKTSALDIFSKEFYLESSVENTTVLPVSVMFSQGHEYFDSCDRFSHLYDKSKSVIANFKYIVKWHASLKPLSAPFRIIVFDGADDLPQDAQAALRRIMERYSSTCRFIFVTSSAARLIDPIRSRCVPLYFLPIPDELVRTYLDTVISAESASIDSDAVDMIAMSAKGDLRKAVMYLELAVRFGIADPAEFSRTESRRTAESAVEYAQQGDVKSTQEIIENMMISYGMTAGDVLGLIRSAMHASMTPELARLFAAADIAVREGQNEYIQMNVFASELAEVLRKDL